MFCVGIVWPRLQSELYHHKLGDFECQYWQKQWPVLNATYVLDVEQDDVCTLSKVSKLQFSENITFITTLQAYLEDHMRKTSKKSEVKVAQSCLTLCDPTDCSPPDSSVYGIFPARILEWVAIPFSKGSSQPRDWTWISCTADRFFYCLSHQGIDWVRSKIWQLAQERWQKLYVLF